MFNWRDSYISYVNLDHRTDRLAHVTQQLDRFAIMAKRTPGMKPDMFDRNDPNLQVQWKRTPGSIGCMMSQMDIMKNALSSKRSAIVFEDDIVLCSDFIKRMYYLQEFLNKQPNWDVAWLGGTVHINPPYWHIGGANPDLPSTLLTKDAEPTDDPRIIKCYGAFSTYAYIVNETSIVKVASLLYDVMRESMGIDWSFIRLGAELDTFMMLPGMVKQIDNMSDIGHGQTIFSGFAALGPYWWQDKMEDFDPSTIKWPS
jgi:Glycosyltransferase family 25 (LPS biosynthesis protein)